MRYLILLPLLILPACAPLCTKFNQGERMGTAICGSVPDYDRDRRRDGTRAVWLVPVL